LAILYATSLYSVRHFNTSRR